MFYSGTVVRTVKTEVLDSLACRLLDLYGRGKVVFTQGLFWAS